MTPEQAYLKGFIRKCAQSDVDPKKLVQRYMQAVPEKPEVRRQAYEQLIDAGGLGITDIGAKSLSDLNQKKLKRMQEWARKNPKAGARISRFLKGKNPYEETKFMGVQKHPVYAAAFPKARKGFDKALSDFVTGNPELIQKLIKQRQTAQSEGVQTAQTGVRQ